LAGSARLFAPRNASSSFQPSAVPWSSSSSPLVPSFSKKSMSESGTN
jgi:hypothetical protein